MTGQFSFNVTTSAGVTFTGDGIMGIGTTGLAFATTTLQSLDPVSTGTTVIDGQINVDTLELTGNIVAGIPDRLGPAPFGFVHTTATFIATRAP